MANRKKTLDPADRWESGDYGRSEEHVAVSHEESDALDRVAAMKLVTMRLPVPLVDALKDIAMFHGIAYQPMVRDLLTRFAIAEMKLIRDQREESLRAAQQPDETVPVTNFMEQKRRAYG